MPAILAMAMFFGALLPFGADFHPRAATLAAECEASVEIQLTASELTGRACAMLDLLNTVVESTEKYIRSSSTSFLDGLGIAIREENSPSPCAWYVRNEPATSPYWGDHSPTDGSLEFLRCGGVTNDGTGGGSDLLDYRFVPFTQASGGGAVGPPPPSAFQLAERAMNQISIPRPSIGVGPDRSRLAVNLWTWLWTTDPGPQTVTVSAGGITVTLAATFHSVTWTLGEPAPTDGPYAPGPAVTITCDGTGSPPPPNYDWKAEPPCGHMYTWMSTKERTGGTGTWPITATSNWNVTWQSNTGVSGTATLTATGTDALEIGEYRIVLVQGPGG